MEVIQGSPVTEVSSEQLNQIAVFRPISERVIDPSSERQARIDRIDRLAGIVYVEPVES